jgi:hypothetical protein
VGVRRLAVVCCALVAACSSPSSDRAPGETLPSAPPVEQSREQSREPAAVPPPVVAAARPDSARLAAPATMRNWTEVRRQAALRLVAANPGITYMGKVPDQLLAIPVLEVELNRDGSVRRIVTLREPRQAKDTLRIATDAIHRAGPYGDVSHLPRPWKFVETFLFDDDRKFKPRTLDN